MKKNVHVIIDGQAGSCGKGKVIGQYTINENIEAAIGNNAPNAGHTFIKDGQKRVFRHIPVSAVNPNTALFMGSGTFISMEALEQEYEENKDILEGREIIVHPNVHVIKEKHIKLEKEKLRSGSTFKGGGACFAEKIMRSEHAKIFKEFKNIKADSNYHEKLLTYLNEAKKVLIEGSQGFALGIDDSDHYPHTTFRNINVARMCDDSGISPLRIGQITMVIRPFPIRISNKTELGFDVYSGDYGSVSEFSWKQISVAASLGQYPTMIDPEDDYNQDIVDLTEKTTVTKKDRRIFDFDPKLHEKAISILTPTEIYMNFFEHLDYSYHQVAGSYDQLYIDKYRREYINWIENLSEAPVVMLGTGPDFDDYIDRSDHVKKLKLGDR